MVVQLEFEVWVNDGKAVIGKIVKIEGDNVTLQTLKQGVKTYHKGLLRPLRELYHV